MKKGISLIVLVITIIVMVVLAASVVLTLSNSGIINKANQAVESTNVKEIEQLASLTWAEEFMAGKRGETLKSAVLEKLKDYTNKYTITVTDTGVLVTAGSAKELNEYGFYYDTVYSDGETAIVATKNAMVEWYHYDEQCGAYWLEHIESVTYEKGKIIFEGWEGIMSKDGRTLQHSEYAEAKLEYTDIEYHDIHYNEKYYLYDHRGNYIVFKEDGTAAIYLDNDTVLEEYTGVIIDSHIITIGEEQYGLCAKGVSINNKDGAYAKMFKSKVGPVKFTITNKYEYLTCYADQNMTLEAWLESEYNVFFEYYEVDEDSIYIDRNQGKLPTVVGSGPLVVYGTGDYFENVLPTNVIQQDSIYIVANK